MIPEKGISGTGSKYFLPPPKRFFGKSPLGWQQRTGDELCKVDSKTKRTLSVTTAVFSTSVQPFNALRELPAYVKLVLCASLCYGSAQLGVERRNDREDKFNHSYLQCNRGKRSTVVARFSRKKAEDEFWITHRANFSPYLFTFSCLLFLKQDLGF